MNPTKAKIVNTGSLLRWTAIAFVAIMTWASLSAAAHAHASLVSSAPQDGAVVTEAPAALSLTFNEPVSPLSLSLIRPDGSTLALDHFALRDRTLHITVPTELGRGTHVLSWRVTSADGHPVGGSVIFSVGEASAAPPVVEEATDWLVRAGIWAGKVALYVGLFVGVGGAFAMAWLLRGEPHGRVVVLAAITTGVLGAIVSAGFQGLDALGAPTSHLADPLVWSTGMNTSFGRTVVVAVLAFAAAMFCFLSDNAIARLFSLVALLLAAAALALFRVCLPVPRLRVLSFRRPPCGKMRGRQFDGLQ